MGNIDRCPTYKGGKVTELVVYVNYIGLRLFYRYVINIGRWSPYEGGQLDRFHCISRQLMLFLRSQLIDIQTAFQMQCQCVRTVLSLPHYMYLAHLLGTPIRPVPNEEFRVVAIFLFYSKKCCVVFGVLLLYVISGCWIKCR